MPRKRHGFAPRPPSPPELLGMDRLYRGAKEAGQDDALKARLKRETDEAERKDRER